MAAELAFWACAAVLAYTYAGYPALVFAWAALRARDFGARPIEPRVSVVLVAHNEAARIAARVRNLLSLDYPRDRLEVLVGSDGSTDGTAESVCGAFRSCERQPATSVLPDLNTPGAPEGAPCRVFAFQRRRGKPAVLNELIPRAQGEIVVLADARQRFDPGAVRALVAPFADPSVGAVSGELMLVEAEQPTAAGEGVSLYWRYEKLLRQGESRVDSTVGATGAVYAIRKELFAPIPEDTILDDVLIPVRIVRQGYRVVFQPAARAYDLPAAEAGEELRRKVRTIAGTFQLLWRNVWLLDPRRSRVWLQALSHKTLRLLTPVCLAGLLCASLLLAASPYYGGALVAQAAFYSAAALAHLSRRRRRRIPLVSVPYVVCLLSWATVVAFWRFAGGRAVVTWERAAAR